MAPTRTQLAEKLANAEATIITQNRGMETARAVTRDYLARLNEANAVADQLREAIAHRDTIIAKRSDLIARLLSASRTTKDIINDGAAQIRGLVSDLVTRDEEATELRETLHHIVNVLGPGCTEAYCEGCHYEMHEARQEARIALGQIERPVLVAVDPGPQQSVEIIEANPA